MKIGLRRRIVDMGEVETWVQRSRSWLQRRRGRAMRPSLGEVVMAKIRANHLPEWDYLLDLGRDGEDLDYLVVHGAIEQDRRSMTGVMELIALRGVVRDLWHRMAVMDQSLQEYRNSYRYNQPWIGSIIA
jgi:hypothetical protein